MRPPMQSAALQQNESAKSHHQQQPLQPQPQVHHLQATVVASPPSADFSLPLARRPKPPHRREVVAEKQPGFACSPAAATTPSVSVGAIAAAAAAAAASRGPPYQRRLVPSSGPCFHPDEDDSVRLVDLSTSPPDAPTPLQRSDSEELVRLPAQRSSVGSDCQYSRSSSSDDGSVCGERLLRYARPSPFDDAAESFIINFPADSPHHRAPHGLLSLPLSETEPLLTNIEPSAGQTGALCLNKNSASLIFTRKEASPATAAAFYGHAGTPTNNNCSTPRCLANNSYNAQRRAPSHNPTLTAANERNRKPSKHLPPQYHHPPQQQRRSLQLNYNNNLVTTSTCGTNNNLCCSSVTGTGTGTGAVNGKEGGRGGGPVLHRHHSGLSSPASTTASATRKQHAYSWYAPVYSALEEELEHDSRDSSPIHNLANARKQHATQHPHRSVLSASASASASTTADNETLALLETRNQINVRPPLREAGGAPPRKGSASPHPPTSLPLQHAHNAAVSNGSGSGDSCDAEDSLGLTGGPLPRRRRFENFLKSLVGLKTAASARSAASTLGETGAPLARAPQVQHPASPEITITRTPSEQNVVVLRAGSAEKLAHDFLQQGSTSSLNVVQQKLWNIVRREGSAASLHYEKSHSIVQYTGLRKCETVLALTRQPHSPSSPMGLGGAGGAYMGSGVFSAGGVEQIRPLNRLRQSASSVNATCSRCSSLLSLAATGSRYSLNAAAHLTPMSASQQQLPLPAFPLRQTRTAAATHTRSRVDLDEASTNASARHSGGSGSGKCSRKSSAGATSATSISPPSNVTTVTLNSSLATSASPPTSSTPTPTASLTAGAATQQVSADVALAPPHLAAALVEEESALRATPFLMFTCKLCLVDVDCASEATALLQCACQFCTECMKAYVEFEISEGAYEISCPDAQCPAQGVITLPEIANLTTANLMKKHHRYRLNREIELDKTRTWCPRAGCETVCLVTDADPRPDLAPSTSTSQSVNLSTASPSGDGATQLLCAVQCPSCKDEFCSACKKAWHPNITCEEYSRRLVADGQDDIGIPFDNDLIKCCPMCAVPIEKDEGCAQMMCKRCKHVFCWYCLASLDDDFLLRHYDKGPCKNKLGHSRASVVWHRAQVIGIFAGFGILLLVASPLLLLAAPCIICCKCRSCSGSKIDEGDGDLDEVTALQS